MSKAIKVVQHYFALHQVVLVEPWNAADQREDFRSNKTFLSRVLLINGDTHLSEELPQIFVDTYGFKLIAEGGVALNPAIFFKASEFHPTATFNPGKGFKGRLEWHDVNDERQSKLFKAEAATLYEIVAEFSRGSKKAQPPKLLSRRKVLSINNARS